MQLLHCDNKGAWSHAVKRNVRLKPLQEATGQHDAERRGQGERLQLGLRRGQGLRQGTDERLDSEPDLPRHAGRGHLEAWHKPQLYR
jgi:hypothetical protein